MKHKAFAATAIGLSIALAGAASAQTSGPMAPQTQTNMVPVAQPGMAVAKVGPGTFVVTPVPGVAAATTVKVQNFSDYDLNKDGVYNPMEFAQAIYFLATTDPVAGNPALPGSDRFYHKGAWQKMRPENAVALLNATADELMVVDMNRDWRVSPAELTAVALL